MENITTPSAAIDYAVDLNFKGVQSKAVETYGITWNIVSTPAELKQFLKEKFQNGQLKMNVFNVPVDPETAQGKQMFDQHQREASAKPFGETFVGGLIQSILFPDAVAGSEGGSGSGSGNGNGNGNGNGDDMDVNKIIILVVAVVGGIILVGTALYFLTRKG